MTRQIIFKNYNKLFFEILIKLKKSYEMWLYVIPCRFHALMVKLFIKERFRLKSPNLHMIDEKVHSNESKKKKKKNG